LFNGEFALLELHRGGADPGDRQTKLPSHFSELTKIGFRRFPFRIVGHELKEIPAPRCCRLCPAAVRNPQKLCKLMNHLFAELCLGPRRTPTQVLREKFKRGVVTPSNDGAVWNALIEKQKGRPFALRMLVMVHHVLDDGHRPRNFNPRGRLRSRCPVCTFYGAKHDGDKVRDECGNAMGGRKQVG
jgi:hypothetical protein